jgi:putative mRNA 3-end processing factor
MRTPTTPTAAIKDISSQKLVSSSRVFVLDEGAIITTQDYGKTTTIDGVKLSFHPAGHILGSSQVRVEYKGEVWVVSGDYKLTPDATCAPFESIKCDHFITEATFGLPIYRWPPTQQIFDEINGWWKRNIEKGKASVCLRMHSARRSVS